MKQRTRGGPHGGEQVLGHTVSAHSERGGPCCIETVTWEIKPPRATRELVTCGQGSGQLGADAGESCLGLSGALRKVLRRGQESGDIHIALWLVVQM